MNLNGVTGSRMWRVKDSVDDQGILVPQLYSLNPSGSTRIVGTLLSDWQGCFQCGQSLGDCSTPPGSSAYDQLSAFRNKTVASYMSAPPPPPRRSTSFFCFSMRTCVGIRA